MEKYFGLQFECEIDDNWIWIGWFRKWGRREKIIEEWRRWRVCSLGLGFDCWVFNLTNFLFLPCYTRTTFLFVFLPCLFFFKDWAPCSRGPGPLPLQTRLRAGPAWSVGHYLHETHLRPKIKLDIFLLKNEI